MDIMMKRILLLLCVTLLAALSSSAAKNEAYAVLSNGNKTLTFFYNTKKETNNGMAVGPFTSQNVRGWHAHRETITKVVFHDSFKNASSITSTAYWFQGCTSLTTVVHPDNLPTADVTTMAYMFQGCSSLTSLDVSTFDTQRVTTMDYMFQGCSSLRTIYCNERWTPKSSSANMFLGCTSLVGGKGTPYSENKVTAAYAHAGSGGYFTMVPYAALNTTGTTLTFYYDADKRSRSGMSVLPFASAADRGWDSQCADISTVTFDTSFKNAIPLTSTAYWFSGFTKLGNIRYIKNLKTTNVTTMASMFQGCSTLADLDVSNFITIRVTNMASMFQGCTRLKTLDLYRFNPDNKVTNTASMFQGCTGLKSIFCAGTWTPAESTDMFLGCTKLAGGDGTRYDENNVNATYAHAGSGGYFTKKTNVPYAVLSNSNHTLTFRCDYYKWANDGMDVGPFTSQTDRAWNAQRRNITRVVFDESFKSATTLTSTAWWFYECENLTAIDHLDYLKTTNVTDMQSMFYRCAALTFLDVSCFRTTNVTNMKEMFYGCAALTTIFCNDAWTPATSTNMFKDCTSIVGDDGTTYSASFTDARRAHPNDGGYFTKAVPKPYAVLSSDKKTLTFRYDILKPTTQGAMGVGPFQDGGAGPDWDSKSITKVVFDPSFAACTTLTSTAGWFSGCENLTTIEGIEYLNTDNVKDMEWMFEGCKSLTTLDLSHFNTSKVTSMYEMFYGCTGLTALDVSRFNTERVTDMTYMFYGCSSLTTLNLSSFNTANVKYMYYMFHGCSALTTLDLSSFNTSNVIYMYDMFEDCSSLTTLDVSGFNTENVINMNYMFAGCSGLTALDVSGFNTENVINMRDMFGNCSSLTTLDVSGFNTENVTSMRGMFGNCSGLTTLDVSGFNTANVTYMDYMFSECSALTTIFCNDSWSPKRSDSMFKDCNNLMGGDGTTTYNAEHIDATYAHPGAGGYFTSLPVEPYAVLSADGTTLTFFYDSHKSTRGGMSVGPFSGQASRGWSAGCEAITSVVFDDSFADCTTLTSTAWWFYDCSALTTIDASNLCVASVTNMDCMFNGCSSLTTIYCNDTWAPSFSEQMFGGCTSIKGGDGTTYDADYANAYHAHPDADGYFTRVAEPYAALSSDNKTLTFYYDTHKAERGGMGVGPFEMDYPEWYSNSNSGNPSPITKVVFDPSFASCTSITSTAYWFIDCENLTTIEGIEHLNTDNVTVMRGMFSYCSSLTNLDLSHFNTEKVTDMGSMFAGCSSLTNLNVSSFNTEKVEGMDYLFFGCSSLTTLDVSRFNTAKVRSMYGMFEDCSSLTTLDVSVFNTAKVESMYGMFSGCSSLTTLDVSRFSTANVTRMDYMFSGCSSLETIFCNGTWNPNASSSMFKGCTSLVGGDGTTYDASYTDAQRAHPNAGGYFTNNQYKNPYAVLSADGTTLTFYYDNFKQKRNGMDVGPFDKYYDRGWYDNRRSITKVVFDKSFASCTSLTSTAWWFDECNLLTTIEGLENLNTANVTNMTGMFGGCSSLTALDVSHFNTANVTSMGGMFSSCSSLTTLDVSHFDTANVTEMITMFCGCSSLTTLDVTNFNTAKVIWMSYMFDNCPSLTTIYCNDTWHADYNVSMFENCTSLKGGDGTPYDENYTDDGRAHPNTGGYFTKKKVPFAVLSDDSTTLTFYYGYDKIARGGMSVGPFDNTVGIWPEWTNNGVYNKITTVVFDPSFAECTTITSTALWFTNCYALKTIEHLEYLHTDNVTDMHKMFYGCHNLERLDLSHFNTANVTNMEGMFVTCFSLERLDLGSFNTANVTSMEAMFDVCSSLERLNVSSFNTANVTTMQEMFEGCTALTSLDVSHFNTEKVTNMASMFDGCILLENLDVSSFTAENVTTMYSMFYGCWSLKTLDLGGFNPSKAEYMGYMFNGCSDLTTIYCDHTWKPSGNSDRMFYRCYSLVGGDGTTYDARYIDARRAHPGPGGYFTRSLLPGDVNGDGSVTPADAIMILYHYFGVTQDKFIEAAADVNGDTNISPADAIEALYIYFGASTSPKARSSLGARSSSPVNSRDPE